MLTLAQGNGMLVDRIRDKRLLVIGDIMVDYFVSGRVERVSPEAPALVLNVSDEASMIGGAGNVAANIASLGGVAILCGVIGRDSAAKAIDDEFRKSDGRLIDLIVRSNHQPTITKTRFVAGDRHLLRTDREEVGLLFEDEIALVGSIESIMSDCDAIVVSDYMKGVVSERVMNAVRDLASRLHIPIIVDPKRRDLRMYAGATVLTPNECELRSFVAGEVRSEDEFARAASYCRTITGADVLLTRSEKGVSLYQAGMSPWHDAAHARRLRDVSGAGDTVTATLALCLAAGMDLRTSSHTANIASSIAVEQSGTSRVSGRELHLRLLRSDDEHVLSGKLATADEARRQCSSWRSFDLTIGFTNGCFDLLHPGHVQLLQEAKRHCDRLIVALNTDASVKRLKGDARPIQSESARAVVIGALEAVDMVLFFDHDTPLEVIKLIQPDILFKGADYSLNTVVGADEVLASGGHVQLIDIVSGHSTTSLIRRSNPSGAREVRATS